MDEKDLKKLYDLLDNMQKKGASVKRVEEIKKLLIDGKYDVAITKLRALREEIEQPQKNQNEKKDEEEETSKYPKQLINRDLEYIYIGLLLLNPKYMNTYFFYYDDVCFEDDRMFNIYKSILFKEGEAFASEAAKRKYNFAKESPEVDHLKKKLKENVYNKNYNMEKVYMELMKLFVLRKEYQTEPVKEMQDKIIDIVNYELYDMMSVDEVKGAIEQASATRKFKQAILNKDLTDFLVKGDNKLTNGISLPFPTLSSVFKGIRQGETMAFAMPSNYGKSRFTINMATYIALKHKKKVLIISNEMSEEKTKLCLITTMLNNPEIQEMHGQKIRKTEGELLEFKFRPNEGIEVEKDDEGFVIQKEDESRENFIKRLSEISTEYNLTVAATDWANKQISNSIYFINITDHTNDELRKVIMNYFYKEKIEYVFYDTLKTDIDNIGNGEELKKTATILSNLAQNFNMFIASTLQLTETTTMPLNLNINDLAVSRTVKEVLDALCLFKQINNENLKEYEYSENEIDDKFYDLEKYKDPNVRYYVCVVDKNRAGAKPKILFKLNLAYNEWIEMGYVRLKQK